MPEGYDHDKDHDSQTGHPKGPFFRCFFAFTVLEPRAAILEQDSNLNEGTTMKKLILAMCVAALCGCATVNYQPYEGKQAIQEGSGGTKVVTDGVDFWANGAPPRKYQVLGVIEGEVGEGIGDENLIRSAVATEVKKQGGDAAILVDGGTSFSGVAPVGGFLMAMNNKKRRFTVIKYLP